MKLIDWIKRLMRIVRNYDDDREWVRKCVNRVDSKAQEAVKLIKERTEAHVDIPHFRGYPCTVVVAGRYKNNDYVQVYQVFEDDFSGIVDHVKQVSKYSQLTNVDAPFQLKEYIRKEGLV